MSEDLAFMPALDLASLIARREISPIDLVQLYLERIERLDPRIGSFVTVDAGGALDSARRASERIQSGQGALPPFLGVPVGIKDVVETAGVRTTFSSNAFADHVPDVDDASWARMKQAGCVLLGKTNTPELAGADATSSNLNGECRNPWDTRRVAGGSSGGSAAAVAAGLCALADGTDGGGSIRTPAACCGVVGIKPSRGLVSLGPRFGQQMNGMVTPGPIARSVLDAAALLDVMAGYEPGDPYWVPTTESTFLKQAQLPVRPLRIAVTTSTPSGRAPAEAECAEAAVEVASLLERLGHHVDEATPPWDDGEAWDAIGLVYASWLCYFPGLNQSDLDPINAFELEVASRLSMAEYIEATTVLDRFARDVVRFFDAFDILLSPSTGKVPPLLSWFDWERPQDLLARAPDFVPTSPVWNVTGQPAASLPLVWSTEGLPIGVQLVSRPGSDGTLLSVCRELEEAQPWLQRRPPGLDVGGHLPSRHTEEG